MNEPASILRRIGLVGDVHGEAKPLLSVLKFLGNEPNIDGIFCTGDIAGKKGAGDSDACAELLLEFAVMTVRGNHDRWALAEHTDSADALVEYSGSDVYRDFAYELPPYLSLQTSFGSGLLCHGVGANDMEGIYPGGDDDAIIHILKGRRIYGWDRVMICGHTHKRLVRTMPALTIINAGTLRPDNEPCFSIVDFESGEAQFYDIASDSLTITTAEAFRFLEP